MNFLPFACYDILLLILYSVLSEPREVASSSVLHPRAVGAGNRSGFGDGIDSGRKYRWMAFRQRGCGSGVKE